MALDSFSSAAGTAKQGQAVNAAILVQGEGTDDLYYLQADVATGALPVAISGSVPTTTGGLTVQSFDYIDTSSTNITNAAYVELIADVGASEVIGVMLADAAGYGYILALGAAGFEVDYMLVPQGGFYGIASVIIPANSRVSLKTITGTAASGLIVANFLVA